MSYIYKISIFKNVLLAFLVTLMVLYTAIFVNSNNNIVYASNTEAVNDDYDPSKLDNSMVPEVTMDEAMDFVDRKGQDVINIVKKVGSVLCGIFFVISAITAVTGIGSKNGFMGGVIGMLVTSFAFVFIMYSEKILAFITSWIAS